MDFHGIRLPDKEEITIPGKKLSQGEHANVFEWGKDKVIKIFKASYPMELIDAEYYNALAVNGVRIFEYTPGFCHAKMSVCDDTMATCGTINLDYRSLYHHFENGCFIARSHVVAEVKKDFEKMFSVSNEVTQYYKSGQRRLQVPPATP